VSEAKGQKKTSDLGLQNWAKGVKKRPLPEHKLEKRFVVVKMKDGTVIKQEVKVRKLPKLYQLEQKARPWVTGGSTHKVGKKSSSY
jgi:hypothetical protein